MLKAAVLNRYLTTWGGGERVTYAVANQLVARGYAVDVLTDEVCPPTPDGILAAFGPGHDGFAIRQFRDERDIVQALPEYSVFVNHCAGNCIPNVSPVGLYFVMFPFQPPGPFLKSYSYFLCNSDYTKFYTRLRWGADLVAQVLYPGADFAQVKPPVEKEKMILTIGRFNTAGHNKNQDVLVDSFIRGLPRLGEGWSLHLVGRINGGSANASYVSTLLERCEGLPIHFHFNASDDEKRNLLSRSSVYWHATGWNRHEPDDAHAMEHFGIAVVEAMGYGCVPLCYASGGPREIIQYGTSGWLFEDAKELIALTTLTAVQPGRLRAMQEAARLRAMSFSRAAFNLRFQALLDEVAP